MKIVRMHKGSYGKIRAFFDLETNEGLVVKGFKIIEGIKGLFVSMPSEKKEDEYSDTCYFTKESRHNRDKLNEIALQEYGEGEEINQDMPEPQQTKTSDDIPF